MNLLENARAAAGRLTALCLAAAALEILIREDDGALGFGAVCRLTVLVAALRLLGELLGGAV